MNTTLIPVEKIEKRILLIRGKKVMIDVDLANLYEVETRTLNQSVKRNIKRFPEDFMFQLTIHERDELITNCDRFKRLKHSTSLPYAFTEQGVAMLSTVLNSEMAINVNIQIMRTFTKLREMIESNKDLRKKIEEIEKKYDNQFQIVFEAIKRLTEPEVKSRKRIGF
ncbi:MAG: DNA-binding protein [Candidatus Melainabacteria bacterium RIFCSPLOWO2_02_FULL_35_15]|nr:MAG: DNA-binding protein [Candidatus Melainabacteria bacterium RIFCSPLOWO2_12_FULL_35_11]OGI13252.1 MAG: DNA-binding protein [Candidatus Melainabacteria bacterium RIFCSPLOWO2_02_FULL_35_15]